MKCLGALNGECLNQCLIVNAVSGLSVGLVLVDHRGKVVWLNRTAEKLLGVELAACSGRSMDHVLKNPQMLAFWHDVANKDANAYAEISVRWPKAMDLKVNATRCLDGEGREIGRAMLVCDITQERAVQVTLSQAVATHLLSLTSGHMPPEPVARLTQQELRMLRLVGQGLGNTEIAAQNNISTSTVRSHLKNLYKKLGLSSRAEAVSFAIRHHLV
ncbi:MAG TPA: LuxR C-terminal-related transcriptional regulator [Phycisphaerae bacterium]|nr:LuxR C-terminal-related transcriptional regulator [Phycisphaerae bacterium]